MINFFSLLFIEIETQECYCPINGGTDGPKCDICEWPICLSCNSEYKKNQKLKYHVAECREFKNAGIKFQNVEKSSEPCAQYECITPLRFLLAIEANPQIFEQQLSKMEYHDEARKKSKFWEIDQINIVNNLLGPCKLNGRFMREIIERAIGILDINVFEARTPGRHPVRCIYPIFSVVAHSCIPNTSHSIKASEGFK